MTDVTLVIEELVLDGVEPDDDLVRDSLTAALAPSLAEHGLEGAVASLPTAVMTAVAGEAS